MELKIVEIDGKAYAEVQDGKPVYVDAGKDLPMDVPGMSNKIKALGSEAKGHREAKEAAEAALKGFEGVDAAAARKALETVRNLDDKKLIDAGEVEKVKAETIKALEAKFQPEVERAKSLEAQLRQEKIGGSFARSKFISDKLAVPAPMVEKTFGEHFGIDGGRIVAKDANGNQIYSRANPGEAASFDEALEMLVEASPYRDSIMKGTGNSGSGARGGSSAGSAKTVSRAQFDEINRSDPGRAAKMVTEEGVTVTD